MGGRNVANWRPLCAIRFPYAFVNGTQPSWLGGNLVLNENNMIPDSVEIIKELGKGKSGISYLAKYMNSEVIFKEMHNEIVSYYKFEKPKIELELAAYEVLKKQNINIPELLEYDEHNGYLIKEYIEGNTITESIIKSKLSDDIMLLALKWEEVLKNEDINIDYYPSNFVLKNDELYYIDYEYNKYSDEWNFRNWGLYYWLNGNGFKSFLETMDSRFINYEGTGIPIKNGELYKERERILKMI